MTVTITLNTNTNRYGTSTFWEAFSSTVTTGTLQTARFNWFLYRAGTLIDQNHTGPCFQHTFNDDDNGVSFTLIFQILEEGSSAPTTKVTTFTQTVTQWDRTYYVDTGGNDSNDGLSTGAAKLTISGAFSAAKTWWNTDNGNRSVKILLKGGQTHSCSARQHYSGDNNVEGRWGIATYSTGTATISMTADTDILTIGQGFNDNHSTLDIRDLIIDGTSGTSDFIRFNANSSATSPAPSFSFVAKNLTCTDLGQLSGTAIDNSSLSVAEATDGRCDHIAWSDITCTNTTSYGHYHGDSHVAKYVSFDNCTWGTMADTGTGTAIREYAWQYLFFRDNLVYDHGADALRFLSGGSDTTIHSRYHNICGVGTYDGPYSFHNTDADGGTALEENRFQDIWYHSVRCNSLGASGAGVVLGGYRQRISVRAGWFRGATIDLSETDTNNDTNQYLHIESNTWYVASAGGGDGVGVRSSHSSGGTLDHWYVQNNFGYNAAQTGSPEFFNNSGGGTISGALSASDYNIWLLPTAGSMIWYRGLSGGGVALSTWQTNTVFDDNSVQTTSGTHGITAFGTSGTADDYDFNISTSSIARNAGTRVYGADIDHDGMLRVSTHDAGANDADATSGPTDPMYYGTSYTITRKANAFNGCITSVDSYASTYNIGIRHIYFDGSGSTSSVGQFWSDGWCEWHVFYPGSYVTPDESYYGTPNFSYLAKTPGTHTIKYRAIDRAGNPGSWRETSTTVANESTANYVQYIDTASGNNSNTGTSDAAPVQTLTQAVTNIIANWTSGGTHIIYVKRGQTPSRGSAWPGHTVTGRIMFRPWGEGSSRAAVDSTSGDVVCGTGQTSIVFWGVDLNFGASGGGVDLDAGFTRSIPYNAIFCDCTLTGDSATCIAGNAVGSRTTVDRDAHVYAFLAVESSTITGTTNPDYAIYGMGYGSLIHIVDSTLGPLQAASTSHTIRVFNVSDFYARGCTFDAQAPSGNDVRLVTGEGSGVSSATRRVTFANCVLLGSGAACYSEVDGNNTTLYARDITVVGCNFMWSCFPSGGGYTGGAFDTDRITHRNSALAGTYDITLHATNGGVGDMVWDNCTQAIFDYGGGTWISLSGAASRYGSLRIRNHVGYWGATGNPEPRNLIYAPSMTVAEVAGILSESNYNTLVKVDAQTIRWVDCTTNNSLASWQSATVHDDNSSATASQTLTFAGGPTEALDPRISSGTFLQGKGLDYAYSLDIDGHIRTGDYGGAHDPDATTYPDSPSLVTYGLVGSIASYLLYGKDVTLAKGVIGFSLVAERASYLLNGKDVILLKGTSGYLLAGDNTTYTIIGTVSNLTKDSKQFADKGSINIIANSNAFNKASLSFFYNGTFTLSGKASITLANRSTVGQSTSYSLNGKNNVFSAARRMAADKTNYTVNYNSNLFNYSRLLDGSLVSYNISGKEAQTIKASGLICSNGTYLISGIDASLLKIGGAFLLGDKGTYTVNVTEVGFIYNRLSFNTGATYSVLGVDNLTTKQSSLSLDPGTYTVNGKAASTVKDYLLSLANATYSVSGQAVNTSKTYLLSNLVSPYSINGYNAELGYLSSSGLTGLGTSYSLNGKDCVFVYNRIMEGASTSYSTIGNGCSLIKNSSLICSIGQYQISGQSAILIYRIPRTSKKGRFKLFF